MDSYIASLSVMRDILQTIPAGPVELPEIWALVDFIPGSGFARIVAPPAVRAAELVVRGGVQRMQPGRAAVIAFISPSSERPPGSLRGVIAALDRHTNIKVRRPDSDCTAHSRSLKLDVVIRPTANGTVEILVSCPAATPIGTVAYVEEIAIAGVPVPLGEFTPTLVASDGLVELTFDQALQLQAWIGESGDPCSWVEEYRASRDGFDADSFHDKCDSKHRLLVLVKEKGTGWLFGGYTTLGFQPPRRIYADPSAFIYSLTNPAGSPEKFASNGSGEELCYDSAHCAIFGPYSDLAIDTHADLSKSSLTNPGRAFAAPATCGTYPMTAQMVEWQAAEVVAWAVPF